MNVPLDEVFRQAKALLKKYEPPLVATHDDDARYELWSKKEIVVLGKKRKEIFFASLIIQSKYVGFYFMPVYTEGESKRLFGEELLGRLKGKSCFHLASLDATLRRQMAAALAEGFRIYKSKGWI